MSAVIDHRVPEDLETEAISRKALGFLSSHNLKLDPRNFEVVFTVLAGRDRPLREAFLQMPKPVSQAGLTELADRFLVARPVFVQVTKTAADALAALADLRMALEAGTLIAADPAGDGNALLARLDSHLDQCLTALQAVKDQVEPPAREVPGQEHLTAQLAFGLGGYSALENRLKELFSKGMPDQGVSLLLCHIEGLAPLERSGLGKVSDYMKNTLGRFSSRLIGKEDAAFWTAPDELGLLIGATSETYLAQLGEKIARVVADADGIARRSIKTLPKMACRFGCARTQRPVLPMQLYGSARQSLQRAELTESVLPVFSEVAGDANALRRYKALYDRPMT